MKMPTVYENTNIQDIILCTVMALLVGLENPSTLPKN